MARVSAIFVAACMVLICASFAAVLYLAFGLPIVAALVCAIAALTGLTLCTIAANAWRGRNASSGQIVDLSRGIADLARQVAELGRRVAATEAKVANALDRAEDATAPLTAEIDEIGVLIRQLAEAVSAHDMALQSSGALRPNAAGSAFAETLSAADAIAAPRPAQPHQGMFPAADRKPIAARRHDADAGGAAGAIEAGAAPESVFKAAAGFKGLDAEAAGSVLREAIEANRLEFHLQPILALPQRKVRYYEALARLRAADGELLAATDFLSAAEAGGLMPRIDNLMVFRCVQVVRRLMSKNRDVGLFCSIAAATLVDAEFFPQFTEFMEANRAIAPALVFEFTQAAYRAFGPIETENLGTLMGWGFRFSLDHVGDLKLEPRDLADRGFRFVKVPATLLLNRHGGSIGDIHPADLTGLLSRFGIELIADGIENEGTVVDLLDYNVKYGQGYLFSQPRPVRAEILQTSVERAGADAPKTEAAPVPKAPEAGGATGMAVLGASLPDARIETLQRPTALAQIARTVAARAAQESVVRAQEAGARS
jgi:cyclic-di-GMP phosphodiesterase TipF (flagellum assembly factor)